jgi:ketosteroid isomerase-like protein
VDINTQVTGQQRQALARLREDPLWDQPRDVEVSEAGDVVSSVCVDGASYDLTLLTDRRAAHVRRSCDPAEVGSAAAVMRVLVEAARGFDPRFDVVFASQRFDQYSRSYADRVASGGRVQAPPATGRENGPPPPPPLDDERVEAEQAILAADRAFAAQAVSTTAAQAFREFMDPQEGLLFQPNGEPVEGADLIFRQLGGAAPETGKLTWEPVQAWASESGDLGASWGRSRLTPLDPTRPAQAFRYLTVWRKDAEGRWKGLMEMSAPAQDLISRPGPAAPAPPIASPQR